MSHTIGRNKTKFKKKKKKKTALDEVKETENEDGMISRKRRLNKDMSHNQL